MSDKAERFVEQICNSLKDWVNHTKEGPRRTEQSLERYDRLWHWTINYIKNLELKSELLKVYLSIEISPNF